MCRPNDQFYTLYCCFSFVIHVNESRINKDGMIEFVIRLQIYNGIQTRWAAKRLGVNNYSYQVAVVLGDCFTLVGQDWVHRTSHILLCALFHFYRAMHFSAKCGIAIACRLSVCPSVCLSVTLVNCDHIGWNSSKIISPLVSLGCLLFVTPIWRVCPKRNTPKFGPKVTHPLLIWASETFDRKLWPNGYR